MPLRRRLLGPVAGIICFAVLAPSASAAPGDFSASNFRVGGTPYDIATGDFNGDGVPDVAVPNANSHDVSVLIGDGDGSFTEARRSPFAVELTPLGLLAGDFDEDGFDDLMVAQDSTDEASVYLSKGDGRFSAGPEYVVAERPARFASGDFNADGDLDVAVLSSYNTDAENAGTVTILAGAGDGSFTLGATFTTGNFPTDIVAGDLNGGGLDLVVPNLESDDLSVLLSSSGSFVAAPTSPETVGNGPGGVAIANLTGDANPDVAVANNFSNDVSLMQGDGTGNLTSSLLPTGGANDVAAGDFDGDSDIDLAAVRSFDVAILLGNGSGAFAPSPGSPEYAVAIASRIETIDLDADDDLDLLVTGGNGGAHYVTALLNDEADTDADGIGDLSDACPGVPSSEVDGCPFIGRTVSLAYAPAIKKFRGRVSSAEPACVGPGVKVKILRRRNSGDSKLGVARTNGKGRFRLRESVKRGRYVAQVKEKVVPSAGRCAAWTSDTVEP